MLNKIKYPLLIIFLSLIWISCNENKNNPVNTNNNNNKLDSNQKESRSAFEYLNLIRQNPNSYSAEIGVDLSTILPQAILKWNDTLEKVAITKANDLANRNYFAHVDPDGFGINYYVNKAGYTLLPNWLTDPKANNFESLAAAYKGSIVISGKDFIKQLIVDDGVPDLGHRKHLLGVGSWFASLVDIGIGIARNPNSNYKNYMCLIIAKHN